jgi:hypothetical protein
MAHVDGAVLHLDQRTKQNPCCGDYVDYAYDPLGQLTNAVGKELGGGPFDYGHALEHEHLFL